MSAGKGPFSFTLFTASPPVAAVADNGGVDRIGLDLDRWGKANRQGPSYRISDHVVGDLVALRRVVRPGALFARADALHSGSRDQVEELLALGADVLMLPMFASAEEAGTFVEMVGGRAKVSLLVETASAAADIAAVVRLAGVKEVFVGLNDLQLSLGLDNRFEVLVSELVAEISARVRERGLRFGLGGIGRAGDETLPVPSSLVYPQLVRLGATSTILARSFLRPGPEGLAGLGGAVAAARAELERLAGSPAERMEDLRRDLERHLALGSDREVSFL